MLERLLRRRFAEQSLSLGCWAKWPREAQAHVVMIMERSEVRHFEGKMKKGMESLGNDINYI